MSIKLSYEIGIKKRNTKCVFTETACVILLLYAGKTPCAFVLGEKCYLRVWQT